MAYILIIISLACGGSACTHDWPVVSMQRFDTAKACQFAAAEMKKLYPEQPDRMRAVCVPEVIR